MLSKCKRIFAPVVFAPSLYPTSWSYSSSRSSSPAFMLQMCLVQAVVSRVSIPLRSASHPIQAVRRDKRSPCRLDVPHAACQTIARRYVAARNRPLASSFHGEQNKESPHTIAALPAYSCPRSIHDNRAGSIPYLLYGQSLIIDNEMNAFRKH